MLEPRPLDPKPIAQVHLPKTPLVKVIAQIRFPPILSIRDPDRVVVLQEALRGTYPHLHDVSVGRVNLEGGAPDVRQELVWRLTDRSQTPHWQVSLGVNFVALDTSVYHSRQDFLDRLGIVVAAVEDAFGPAEATRLGLRYVDRLKDEAVACVNEMFRQEILGIMDPVESTNATLGQSVIHLLNDAQFLAQNGSRIQGRWGKLPPNATYEPEILEPLNESSWILDLDMFTTEPRSFENGQLLQTAAGFAECLYWLFRQMITDKFLRFYGGNI